MYYTRCIFSMLYTILLFFWDGEFGLLSHSRVTQRFVPLHQCGKYLAYLRCCCQRLIALYYVKDVGAGMKYKHEFSWFFFWTYNVLWTSKTFRSTTVIKGFNLTNLLNSKWTIVALNIYRPKIRDWLRFFPSPKTFLESFSWLSQSVAPCGRRRAL